MHSEVQYKVHCKTLENVTLPHIVGMWNGEIQNVAYEFEKDQIWVRMR